MSGVSCFVDTNLLVYFRDASEPKKQAKAAAWLAALWRTKAGRISTQVLSEFYVTVTQRLNPGMKKAVARADVRNLAAWHPIPVDTSVIEGAWTIQDRHKLSWWDALIVAAAQKANCAYLLSEDFQDAQTFAGVRVVNPFAHEPGTVLDRLR
jgi:predicted nucleic acid-binding protein